MKTKLIKQIWIKGGLGNILFQGFIGHLISEKGHNVSFNGFLTKKNIITKLLKWTLHENNFHEELLGTTNYTFNIDFFNFIKLIVSKTIKFNFKSIFIFENEGKIRYDSTHYFGYFQSSSLIKNNLHTFRNYCNDLRKKLKLEEKHLKTQVVVHFRWGDSTWAKKNKIYYEKILEILKTEYEGHQIYIVTDDINKANSFFSLLNDKKILKRNTMEDFKFLCNSSILFVSPSTFSWWASQIGVFNLIYFPSNFKDFIFDNKSPIIFID